MKNRKAIIITVVVLALIGLAVLLVNVFGGSKFDRESFTAYSNVDAATNEAQFIYSFEGKWYVGFSSEDTWETHALSDEQKEAFFSACEAGLEKGDATITLDKKEMKVKALDLSAMGIVKVEADILNADQVEKLDKVFAAVKDDYLTVAKEYQKANGVDVEMNESAFYAFIYPQLVAECNSEVSGVSVYESEDNCVTLEVIKKSGKKYVSVNFWGNVGHYDLTEKTMIW